MRRPWLGVVLERRILQDGMGVSSRDSRGTYIVVE
jgi:hypothetical protein